MPGLQMMHGGRAPSSEGVLTRACVPGALALPRVQTRARLVPRGPWPQRVAACHRPPCRPPRAPARVLRRSTARAPACRRGPGRLPQPAPAGLGGARRAAARALPPPRHARGARHRVTSARAPQRCVGTAAPGAPGPGRRAPGAAVALARPQHRAAQGGPVQGEGRDRALGCARWPSRLADLLRRGVGGWGPGLHPPWGAEPRAPVAVGSCQGRRGAGAALAPLTSAQGGQTRLPGAPS